MIRPMAPADIPAAMHLKEAEGWNQTERDWLTALELEPRGCLVFEQAGEVVGTVTTVGYGDRLGWIGMMLVDAAHRRQGIGTALMEAALNYLDGRGVREVKLDATEMGHLVYERLGFVEECAVERWVGTIGEEPGPERLGDGEEIASGWDRQLDCEAFGLDRGRVIALVRREWPRGNSLARSFQQRDAQALVRPGARFWYLGPFVARESGAAGVLLDGLLDRYRGLTFAWDQFSDHAAAPDLARRWGFAPRRRLIRMARSMRPGGSETPLGDRNMQFGIAAFEFG